MIKLFIADDEQIVIDSIKFILEKNFDNIEIAGYAKSGREAIEKALALKPDIIFMDIRMPGIDGIEAIRQIKAKYEDAMFVIVTAYEYFNYAKDAVNLGVSEYLLKPVSKNKIIDTVKRLSENISSKRESMLKDLELQEKINKVIPYVEGQFVYSQLFNGRTMTDLSFYEEMFGMKLGYGYVMVGIIDELKKNSREENIIYNIEKQNFYENFKNSMKDLAGCLVGPPLLDRAVAYVPVDRTYDIYEIKNNSIELGKRLVQRIDENIKIHFKIGIGRVYNLDNFVKSYEEADMACGMPETDIISHFDDIVIVSNKPNLYPINKEKNLVERLGFGDLEGSLVIFDEIFNWLVINYREDMEKIKFKLMELSIVVKKATSCYLDEDGPEDQKFILNIVKTNDLNELKFKFVNNLKDTIKVIAEIKKKEMDGLISRIIKYINENYSKNITLNDAAREINMSYHYFSKFFKDCTGKNFTDYLTDLRVLKSKELLKKNNISIKEICYSMGYSDPNYFSKIFKKATGLTPTEYRANQIPQEV